MTELATTDQARIMEQVMVVGDLAKLTPEVRAIYYLKLCESLGLNPLTKPFEYIELDGKLTLYPRRDATDQLRRAQNISITITDRRQEQGLYIVTARAVAPDGRTDEATGVVVTEKEGGDWKTAQSGKRYFQGNGQFEPLRGADLANALMKAETKAKRRVTLSICGLGFIGEDELDTMRYRTAQVNHETGEIYDASPVRQLPAPQNQADMRRLSAELKSLRAFARQNNVAIVRLGDNPTIDEMEQVITLQREANQAAINEMADEEDASFTPPEQEPAPLAA